MFDVPREGELLDEWNDAEDPAARERAERRRARQARRAGGPPEDRVPPSRGPPSGRRLRDTRWGRALIASVGALALFTVIGLLLLWPSAQHHGPSQALGGKTFGATVTAVRDVRCPGPTPQRCRVLSARLDDGPKRGTRTSLDLGPAKLVSSYSAGDKIRVQPVAAPPGSRHAPPYQLAGLDRRGTLRWLVILFAALVIALTRWRGVLALAGFALSLLLVVKFLVPAILAGSPPLLVAVVGALAVMFITVGLTYGISPQSAAAVLGISASLLFAGVAGTIAVHAAQLDGRSSDLAIYLQQTDGRVSLQGIVLAGLVLGALGVLADMAVTQASAVMALRKANPELGARAVFTGAFGVGRDHLVATTHTLVLVYVGATLPLLLVLQSAGVSATDALNAQDVAEPVVATLVGALALLLSVPLTTALAAALATHVPADALREPHHGHHH
ncbi:MAG TPA: YibE/F family protein [Solirubrobacteraceae bacterium]